MGNASTFTLFFFLVAYLQSVLCSYTCLFGNDLPEPKAGTLVADCGPQETCYLEQYITPAGYVRNKVGCKNKQFCGHLTISNPNIGLCSECCNWDLCATTLCGNTGWPANTGPICYHCDYNVDKPDLCDSIRVCGKDEKCGVNQLPGGKYEVKCMRQAKCSQISATSACASCCTSQLCNSNCNGITRQQTAGTTKATTATLTNRPPITLTTHPVAKTKPTSDPLRVICDSMSHVHCANDIEPVCGSDDRTYVNTCEFHMEVCQRHDLTIKHIGFC